MKAMVYDRYGSPEMLRLTERAKPAPTDDEVLVEVRASSINSWDWDLLRGRPYLTRIAALRKPPHPVLGADVAGRVEAVGRNVRDFQAGNDVYGDLSGSGWGGFAEYATARADVLARMPASLTFEQAASIPQAGVLALQALRKAQLREGQRVVINGAGGGVGTIATQVAKAAGAEVTGVDRADKLDLLREIGADHVIDFAQQDFTRNGRQYDLIVDVVARRSVFDYARALAPGGRFVIVGGATWRILQVVALGPVISRLRGKKLGLLLHRPNRQDLEALAGEFDLGRLQPVIDRTCPLSDLVEAFRYFGAGNAKGKVVIAVEHRDRS
jgi:NADPH:quinone reductase-like Zn-dependent oxidoreductase